MKEVNVMGNPFPPSPSPLATVRCGADSSSWISLKLALPFPWLLGIRAMALPGEAALIEHL